MTTSKHIYTYEMEQREGHTLLTAKEWPWCVLQIVPTTPDNFEVAVAQCKAREGFVATMAPTVHLSSYILQAVIKEAFTLNGTLKLVDRIQPENILTP